MAKTYYRATVKINMTRDGDSRRAPSAESVKRALEAIDEDIVGHLDDIGLVLWLVEVKVKKTY